MKGLFSSRRAMHDYLKTNAVTFAAISSDDPSRAKGATNATVIAIVKNFFETLVRQKNAGFSGNDDVFGFVAFNLYNKYASAISELDFDSCVIPIDSSDR